MISLRHSFCRWSLSWLLGLICSVRWTSTFGAETTNPEAFSKQVQPILVAHCVKCHNAEDRKGDFSLQTQDDLLLSGFVELGKPDESLLIDVLVPNGDAPPAMPKDGKPLNGDEVEILRDWIKQGAPWPTGVVLPSQPAIDLNWWSLKPIAQVRIPVVPNSAQLPAEQEWSRNPIDLFILEKLHASNLHPAPIADRRTLIRRIYYDLIGLPPSATEIETFVSDPDPLAFEKIVDRLLASPKYGEHWARHWLDIVHYADTHGYDKDKPRPNAWPYRDYVIRALNEDRPYSTFVTEQIAGDVLWPTSWDSFCATGFLAAGPWDFIGHAEVPESKTDGKIARNLDRDDMVSTTLNTFCSLTVQCARCHDHKLDPVSSREYYSLQAVFAALDRADREFDSDPAVASQRRLLRDKQDALRLQIAELVAKELDSEPSTTRKNLEEQLAELGRDLEALPETKRAFTANVYQGSDPFRGRYGLGPRTIHVLARGDVTQPREEVKPNAVSISPELSPDLGMDANSEEGARRVALAKWITDKRHPLTWRSIVNRVWQYHFDRGLVDTANDFGRGGQTPSHPELLDWLASRFRDNGGSLKDLHRLICSSATYQQASLISPAVFAQTHSIDAENRLLWRMNRRRLTAEQLRDSMLFASGDLDTRMGGPGFMDFVIEQPDHSPHYEYSKHNPRDGNSLRRSIYRFIVRSQPQPFLTTLDCADPSLSVARRSETQTPLQALAMLNSTFVRHQAQSLADHLQSNTMKPDDCIIAAFRRVLGRSPSDDELHLCRNALDQHGLTHVCHILLNLNEFAFVD